MAVDKDEGICTNIASWSPAVYAERQYKLCIVFAVCADVHVVIVDYGLILFKFFDDVIFRRGDM